VNPQQTSALDLHRRGWVVLPAHDARGTGGGKVPLSKEWQKAQRMRAEEEVVETWSGEHPYNISILTGTPSGIFVLDIDPDNGGVETMKALGNQHGRLPATYIVQTGSGGWHYYFQMPDFELRNSAGRVGPGIDTRGDGGQVIAAGSVSSRGPYVVLADADVAPAPDWLLEMLRPKAKPVEMPSGPIDLEAAGIYEERAVQGNVDRLEAMKDAATADPSAYRGEPWNTTTFVVACRLLEFANSPWASIDEGGVLALLMKHAPRDAGFTDDDIRLVLESAKRKVGDKQATPPRGHADDSGLFRNAPTANPASATEVVPWGRHTWDDFGNAARTIELHGKTLRWVPELKTWLEYDGRRWIESTLGGERKIMQMLEQVRDLEMPLYSPAVDPDDKKGRTGQELFAAWLSTQRYSARVKAGASIIQATGNLDAASADFDNNPDLLNTANGVVDLLSGYLLPHEPEQMLRRMSPVEYDPTATAPLWEAFLEKVHPDPEIRRYLQRVVGYSITGRTDEQVFFLHHGVTKNGKSVFLRIMEAVLGELSQVIPPKTLLVKREDQHPTDIDRMEGKRFLQLSETPQGAQLDETLVKRLTGEETITARGMGRDFREFRITGKVHVVTNHLPHINHDEATMRRIRVVKWGVTIPEHERDKNLAGRIIATELPGVLAWAIRGAMEWREYGLAEPFGVQAETETFIAREDVFARWMDERAIRVDGGAFTATDVLYTSYKSWCEFGSLRPMSRIAFGRELGTRGFTAKRTESARGWELTAPSLGMLP
jgi:putative DNA primase/helicase